MPHPHIILTLGRSGSNTLVDMLNQNPAILNYGEVLGEWNRIRKAQRSLGFFRNDDQAYLDGVLDSRWLLRFANTHRSATKLIKGCSHEIKRIRRLKTVGFKEFSLNFERYSLNDYLHTRSDTKIIALTRSNVIERMISNEFLSATGIVSSQTKGAGNPRIKLSLPLEEVVSKLETIEKENLRMEAMIAEIDEKRVYHIDYADLYADPDNTVAVVRRLYNFLEVDDMMPAVRMTKLIKRDPLASLGNGDAVREMIRYSRFARFLCDN